MATLGDMVSSIRSAFKLVSLDDVISDRYIASELRNTAIKLIKQQTDKRKLLASPNIFTEIKCVQMQEVSLAECCDYTSPCTIARSVEKLPKIADNIYGLMVQGVYSLDKRYFFTQSNARRYANSLLLPLKKKSKLFWFQDGYLYITDPSIEVCTVVAFFEEDVDFQLYTCDSPPDCPTNPMMLEFKCPGFLQRDVLNEVMKIISDTYKRSKEDESDDDNDTAK